MDVIRHLTVTNHVHHVAHADSKDRKQAFSGLRLQLNASQMLMRLYPDGFQEKGPAHVLNVAQDTEMEFLAHSAWPAGRKLLGTAISLLHCSQSVVTLKRHSEGRNFNQPGLRFGVKQTAKHG
jgi:hypothetical protein